jgi:hypothetical protein
MYWHFAKLEKPFLPHHFPMGRFHVSIINRCLHLLGVSRSRGDNHLQYSRSVSKVLVLLTKGTVPSEICQASKVEDSRMNRCVGKSSGWAWDSSMNSFLPSEPAIPNFGLLSKSLWDQSTVARAISFIGWLNDLTETIVLYHALGTF